MRTVLLKPAGTDEAIEVRLERVANGNGECYLVTLDGADAAHPLRVEVERHGDGGGHLRIQGRITPYRVDRRYDVVDVWTGGRSFSYEIASRTARRATESAGAGAAADLTAPMPGRVLEIKVAPGDCFDAHAALIVMESMKMEMTLSAPSAGRVTEMLCAEGQLVEMGELLARLEPMIGEAAGVPDGSTPAPTEAGDGAA